MIKDIDIKFDDYESIKYLKEEKEHRAKKYWINKNGERVDITTMDDEYLQNCIDLMEKTLEKRENDYYKSLGY